MKHIIFIHLLFFSCLLNNALASNSITKKSEKFDLKLYSGLKTDRSIIKKDSLIKPDLKLNTEILSDSLNSNTEVADKLAEDSYKASRRGFIFIFILPFITIPFAIIAIRKGKKAIKLNAKKMDKAKLGIKIGRLGLKLLVVNTILFAALIWRIVTAITNKPFFSF